MEVTEEDTEVMEVGTIGKRCVAYKDMITLANFVYIEHVLIYHNMIELVVIILSLLNTFKSILYNI